MRTRLILTLGLALGVFMVLGMTNGIASAQGDPGTLPENHYKVYEVPAVPPPSVLGPIGLRDQFGSIVVSTMILEKFGIPAEKHHLDATGEVWPILDPFLHHTWWKFLLTYPEVRRADVLDQFGGYSWRVRQPEYLLAPADKNQALGAIPPGNHYLCYLADDAPVVNIEVALVDQVDSVAVLVLQGRYLCNPVEKDFQGVTTPIVDPAVHLTCYEVINPTPYAVTELVNDQFGERIIVLEQNTLLCLPAEKDNVVPVEARSWGRIKALYR
jgi:hypothetical protein